MKNYKEIYQLGDKSYIANSSSFYLKKSIFIWIPKNAGHSIYDALLSGSGQPLIDLRLDVLSTTNTLAKSISDGFKNRMLLAISEINKKDSTLFNGTINKDDMSKLIDIASRHNEETYESVIDEIKKDYYDKFYDPLVLSDKDMSQIYQKIKSYHNLPEFNENVSATFTHMCLKSVIGTGHVSQKYVDECFKFCFVRNPYDRIVSLWRYMEEIEKQHSYDFKDFCVWISSQEIEPISIFSQKQYSIANQQCCWISEKIDFIGRVENIEEDFQSVCDHIGLKNPGINRIGAMDRDRDYRIYYDDKTVDIVSKMYKDDLNRFDYCFEQ